MYFSEILKNILDRPNKIKRECWHDDNFIVIANVEPKSTYEFDEITWHDEWGSAYDIRLSDIIADDWELQIDPPPVSFTEAVQSAIENNYTFYRDVTKKEMRVISPSRRDPKKCVTVFTAPRNSSDPLADRDTCTVSIADTTANWKLLSHNTNPFNK